MKNTAFSFLGCACLVLSAFLAGLYLGRGMSGGVETQIISPSVPTVAVTSTQPTDPTETTGTPETQAPTVAGKININTASVEQLMTLPGIGEVYAKRIVEYRTLNGPFKAISDITKVEGIGKKRFESIMDQITVGG